MEKVTDKEQQPRNRRNTNKHLSPSRVGCIDDSRNLQQWRNSPSDLLMGGWGGVGGGVKTHKG